MDFAMGSAGGSGDDQHNHNHNYSHKKSSNKGKKAYHGHNADRTSKLEEMFRKCPHPTKSTRCQIAEELGLDPKQVKFWFQNKRTQIKTQTERTNNSIFRIENERIRNDNLLLREAFKNIICPSCGGPSNVDEKRQCSLEQLRLENARLREEHEKVSSALAKYMDKPMLDLNMDYTLMRGSSSQGGSMSDSFQDEDIMSNPGRKITQMEKIVMSQIAVAAKEELIKLLCTNEPIWVKSSNDQRFVLHLESYETFFPRINHFKNSQARVESSKDSRVVRIKATELVDMFLNSENWANLFSTIVTKARTIEVLENGSNRSGVLLLMNEEMHVLSPLVPSRELCFLRYCEQIEAHSWVIVDVSVDCTNGNNNPKYWRCPSGCMIHEISNELCWISWVEHVEVDEKIETHQLYKDIVNNNIAYGAERWLLELQRMCARFTSVGAECIPNYDFYGVITTLGGRKNMMNFSDQMVKNFYGILNISTKRDFLEHLPEENINIRITTRKYTNSSQSNAMIIFIATTSFRLPLPSENVFDFFRDPIKRAKWDVMCYESPVNEVARISIGTQPSNYISIIQPVHRTANNMAIIQESCIDPLGSYVVYSPVNISDIKMAINGEESTTMAIFPSGIVISKDERSITNAAWSSGSDDTRTHSTLLTVAFQILMNGPTTMIAESKTVVNSLMTSTIQNINHALINGSNLEF
ncbi:hypothetical protein VNO80_29339 [Phaseolus coccineus]|uniref:Uncharacterized protein n=1 Tax=Phaseolus coccineus TaxID=3886 RepID=A0AAN9QEX0_PHACN